MEVRTVYFENTGEENTDETLRIARQRADELGIKTVAVASIRGNTAVKAVDVFKGLKVVVVTLATGFREPDVQAFTDENRRIVEGKGGIILTATHAFGGLAYAVRTKFETATVGNIVAGALYTLGNGFKVACEIAMMAADAGLARTDEEVISMAGSSRGVDTAIVLNPVNTSKYFDMRVKEILCKPRF